MIRIVLVDDHPMVLKGLRLFLQTQGDMDIVSEVRSGEEAIEQAVLLKPDILLMDLIMPGMSGIEATRRIKECQPEVKVIVLTSFSDLNHVLPAIKAGAVGYQLKEIEEDQLAESIREAYQGRTPLHPKAAELLMQHVTQEPPSTPSPASLGLTAREQEVLKELSEGKSNKAIASSLVITEKTVKTHISSILSKLGLTDRTQAAVYTLKQGWFE